MFLSPRMLRWKLYVAAVPCLSRCDGEQVHVSCRWRMESQSFLCHKAVPDSFCHGTWTRHLIMSLFCTLNWKIFFWIISFFFFFLILCKTVFYIVLHPLLHKALQHMKSLQGELLVLLLLSHLMSGWRTLLDIWWHVQCLIKRADFKKIQFFLLIYCFFRLWRYQSYTEVETRW